MYVLDKMLVTSIFFFSKNVFFFDKINTTYSSLEKSKKMPYRVCGTPKRKDKALKATEAAKCRQIGFLKCYSKVGKSVCRW